MLPLLFGGGGRMTYRVGSLAGLGRGFRQLTRFSSRLLGG